MCPLGERRYRRSRNRRHLMRITLRSFVLASVCGLALVLAACGGSTQNPSDRVVDGEGKVRGLAATSTDADQAEGAPAAKADFEPVAAERGDFDYELKPSAAVTKAVQPGPKTFDLLATEDRVKVGDRVLDMWTFNRTVPGPVMRVVEGDRVTITMKNDGDAALPHSIDFHSARISPTRAFRSIQPGETISYTFTAEYPGVFMYHCGTPPVLQHIGMGMYGMMIVQPKDGYGKDMQELAIVQSELYEDYEAMQGGEPAAYAFNGIPSQYAEQQIHLSGSKPNVRIFFLNAGPSEVASFHVVGTVFDRVLAEGNPENLTVGRQALVVPASGGGVFEMQMVEDGSYPFVSHQFDQAGNGAVGMIHVGPQKAEAGEHY